MGWAETNPVHERRRFMQDYDSGQWSMTELCARYGVSRKSGYGLVARVREHGDAALEGLSRAPLSCPHETADDIVDLIVAERRKVRWGARKLLRVLATKYPKKQFPARSTVADILDRHGLVERRRRRTKWKHPGVAPAAAAAPNDLWTVDFKGQFRTGDGVYCYPLTIVDLHSRYLLRVHALPSVRTEGAKPVFERLFRDVGLPGAIRSDNGPPFASTGIHGLCELNAWWMRLGIVHQRIHPSSPQENGAHERMHKTLKRDTARPPAASMAAQQRRFDGFVDEFNQVRPHEALDDETPGSIWTPSPRPYPHGPLRPDYPGHCEIRRVSRAGTVRLFSTQVFLSHSLADDDIALEEVDDGLWTILFYQSLIGRFDQRTGIITGADFRHSKG